ncbi:MAG: prolyl-tRNA synthetase associated domain-containing protein [Clostridia bacterium]|nr:prolyl-tRNA synthetase associated domain-containing protein [Clostridia bacterium]
MELHQGRPVSTVGRTEKEIATYDFLDALGLSYRRVDHAPAMTMAVCEEIDRALEATICKNLFLSNRQGTDFYLLMMPGDKPFKTKDLSAQLGTARLSFGAPEKMEELLHTAPGSASVLGLMHDKENRVQLVIDREVLEGEFVGCHPLVNTASLRLRTSDLKDVILPAVGHTPIVVELARYEAQEG